MSMPSDIRGMRLGCEFLNGLTTCSECKGREQGITTDTGIDSRSVKMDLPRPNVGRSR